MAMYIRLEDFNYFEQLLNGLGEAEQKQFLALLKQAGRDRAGTDITKIRIVDDRILDKQAIEPQEMITRTMIRKAFKAVKERKVAK